MGLGPHPVTSFNLHYLSKGPFYKYSHTGARASIYVFVGGWVGVKVVVGSKEFGP